MLLGACQDDPKFQAGDLIAAVLQGALNEVAMCVAYGVPVETTFVRAFSQIRDPVAQNRHPVLMPRRRCLCRTRASSS